MRDLVGPSARRRVVKLVIAMLLLAQGHLLVGGWLGPANNVVAQVATPIPLAGLPDPAECTIEPRPIEDFRSLSTEPPGERMSTPDMVRATPPPDLQGEPASAQIVAAVSENLRERVACYNAGDARRSAALYTDAGFHSFFIGPGPEIGDDILSALLTPRPIPPDRRKQVPVIEDIRVLPDGRVTAVIWEDGIAGLNVFVPSDDRYLLDAAYELDPTATPAPQ